MAWDKTKPAGNTPLNASDNLIRQNWAALEDALARDHNFPGTEGSDAGEHEKVTLREQTEKPSIAAGKHVLYAKNDGIYIEKSDGTEIKIFSFDINKVVNIEEINNVDNADKVDGFDASQTKTGDTIPVADENGWINDWINQGEGSGLDADKIRGLDGDFSCMKGSNGYTKLPNGIIIQWGVVGNIQGDGEITVNFNIEFPHLCFVVVATADVPFNTDQWATVRDINTTSFVARMEYYAGNKGEGTIKWIAIGY